jgi:ABC-2 type transport system ATP-binding protein
MTIACQSCGRTNDSGASYCRFCGRALVAQVTQKAKQSKEAIVQILNISKKYGNVAAVDGLSLDVIDGEILGLLGPNGAGKTTTLLMLTTVTKPTAGTATIGGYDIREKPYEVRKLVGIAFQEPKLYWINSPLEILNWHAKVCGTPDRRSTVEGLMRKMDIWEARKKLAHELSGGMKKRVEMAKIMIQRPRIAIVDEPTAQIDVAGKYVIWEMIRELRDEGSTIILATNELSEADRLSDRVAIMHRGKLAVCDTPRNLKDSITGGDVVDIRLETPPDRELLLRIESIENVHKAVQVKPSHLRIYMNRSEKLMPKIMALFLESGIPLSSVSMKEPSLDDVFLHYTGLTLEDAHERISEGAVTT